MEVMPMAKTDAVQSGKKCLVVVGRCVLSALCDCATDIQKLLFICLISDIVAAQGHNY